MRSVRCFLAFQRFLDILEELLNALYGAPMAFNLLFPAAGYRVVDQRELVLTPSPQARRILWCRYELGAVQIRSHSQGPSCGKRRQWPNSNSVLKKFDFSQSTSEGRREPAFKVSAKGPAMVAPGPRTAW